MREFQGQSATAPCLVDEPVFLVGAERSGTTLLRLMLDHHPLIAFHFEFDFAVDMVGPDGELPPIGKYHEYITTHRVFLHSGAQIDSSLDYRRLVNSFLIQKRNRDRKTIVGATVHHAFDRLPMIWPHARYIHLVRDGRDVARSVIQMGWAGNTWFAVDRWIEAERAWDRLCRIVPEQRRIELRFEQLVTETESALDAICRFMGIEFNRQMLNYSQTTTYRPPEPSVIARWRELRDDQIQHAEAKIGEMLLERGYELSGLPRIEIGNWNLCLLKWHDWWRRGMFRLDRYGGVLFVADYLARHLQITPLVRRLNRKIDQIDNSHLQ